MIAENKAKRSPDVSPHRRPAPPPPAPAAAATAIATAAVATAAAPTTAQSAADVPGRLVLSLYSHCSHQINIKPVLFTV